MKAVIAVTNVLVVLFWVTMNGLVFLDEKRLNESGRIREGLTSFVGTDLYRERWMSIYKGKRKIGYSGMTVEKMFSDEGIEFHSRVELLTRVDLFGKGNDVRVNIYLTQDDALRPLALNGKISFGGTDVKLHGSNQDGRLVVTARAGEINIAIPLPTKDLVLSNGLTPVIPLGDLRVGETVEVRCFDPILMQPDVAEVKVQSMTPETIDGFLTEVYTVETRFKNHRATSEMTRDGIVLRQTFGPPFEGISLRRVSATHAKKGLSDD